MDARWQALRAEEEVLGESEGGHKSTVAMPSAAIIPALVRLRQGDHQLQTSPGYRGRCVSKRKQQKDNALV